MICKTCGSTMGLGAPHSEEIKTQYECWCGNIETENYTPEELEERRTFEQEVADVAKHRSARS